MPSTPIYGITYPCLSPVIDPEDFAALATTTEAAIAAVDVEATDATHLPTAGGTGGANPAAGAELTLTYGAFPTTVFDTPGILDLNTGTGVFTPAFSGLYVASMELQANQSTLTITSQRLAVYVNGVFAAARKTRGTNPASFSVNESAFTVGLYLTALDSVTFRYLWTGTGALSSAAFSSINLSMLSRT